MTDGGGPANGVDVAAAARVLRAAIGAHGGGPLEWAAAPLVAAGSVLDLCCGAGLMSGEFPAGRWVGVDPAAVDPPAIDPAPAVGLAGGQAGAAAGRRPVLRAEPTALPLRMSSVDGVMLFAALPRLPDLDATFAEIRRVIRAGGTFVVVVPSAQPRSMAELRLAPVLSAVHRGWRHRSALDRAGWLLAAADFAVLGDDRVLFTVPLPDAAAARDLVADLPRAGLWPPDLPADVRARAAERLAQLAGPGRVLPVPLRRLVARR